MYARRLQQLRRREHNRHEQPREQRDHAQARHELMQHAARLAR